MRAPHSNRFKAALQRGEPQLGAWAALASPYTIEIAAECQFDWLMIDAEHGPNDVRTILSQLQAVEGRGVQAIVRPPVGETWIIKQLLDIGVQTLLVPMVDTAEQAAAVVAASRYPPDGVRGIGATLARASKWNNVPNFLAEANAEVCVLVQVESVRGIGNIEEIAAVPGVDGIFVGPSDLAADMGLIGQSGHPEVRTVVEDAFRRIVAAGRPAGVLTTEEASVRRAFELGCTFVAVGSDVAVFNKGMHALAAAGRAWMTTEPRATKTAR